MERGRAGKVLMAPGQAAVCGVRGGGAPQRSGSGSCPTLGGGGKLPGGDSAATAAYVPLASLFRSRAPRHALLSHHHTRWNGCLPLRADPNESQRQLTAAALHHGGGSTAR